MSASTVIDSLMSTILISLVVLGAGLLILCVQGGRLLSVQSASMAPVFRPGDAIVVRRVDVRQLQIGQIISYHDSRNLGFIVSHRLIKINNQTHLLTTAGDVTKSPDKPIADSQVIGRAELVLPKFGYVLDWLKRPLGLLTAIIVPLTYVVVYELRRLAKESTGIHYRLHDY